MWWTVRLHLWSSPSHRWGAAGNSFWWHSRIVVVAFSNQPLSVHPSVHLAPCLCPSVTLCQTPLSSEHLDCETTWIVRLSEHLDYHIPPQVATQCHPPWLGIAAGWRGARHNTTTNHKPHTFSLNISCYITFLHKTQQPNTFSHTFYPASHQNISHSTRCIHLALCILAQQQSIEEIPFILLIPYVWQAPYIHSYILPHFH